MNSLKPRLLRALRSGSTLDFTTRNLARALKVNERAVRRELNGMRATGEVRAIQAKGPGSVIEWEAA